MISSLLLWFQRSTQIPEYIFFHFHWQSFILIYAPKPGPGLSGWAPGRVRIQFFSKKDTTSHGLTESVGWTILSTANPWLRGGSDGATNSRYA
jgi:hypothetical protein